ncbi:MAG: SPOR domain-containing protein [Rickettsiales bacterium]|jgi:cell division septation protein DedD|nr:SPOR domain-containing protein [Rickettsiales bacterium]
MKDNKQKKEALNNDENNPLEEQINEPMDSQSEPTAKEQNDIIDEELFEEQTKNYSVVTLSIIIAVSIGLMLGAWYIYKSYQTKNYDEVIVVSADDDEIKSQPADPGGMIVKNMDKDIYDNIDRNRKNHDKTEVLLPPAEEPIDKKDLFLADMSPTVKKLDETSEVKEKEETIAIIDSVDKTAVTDDTSKKVVPQETTNNTPDKTEEVQSTPKVQPERSTVTMKAPVMKPSETKNIAPKAEPKKTEEYIKPVTKKESKKKPEFVQKSDNSYKVQIASFKSVSDAEKSWKSMSRKHSSVLKGYKHYIVSKDIPGKGIFQRLQVGPFKNKDLAQKACANFKDAGMNCFVIKP